jgi:hypothetical protein
MVSNSDTVGKQGHHQSHYADYEYGSAQRLLVHFHYLQLTELVQILAVSTIFMVSAFTKSGHSDARK